MAIADQLRVLHRLLRQISDLRGRLERGPKQIKASLANVQQFEAEREAAKEAHKKAHMTADSKQLQLKGREDHITKLQGQLNTAQTNIEFTKIKEQIAADEQANSVLSDEILEVLEKMDEWEAAISKVEENVAAANAELEKVKEKVAGEQATLESELARVTSELEAAEGELKGDFKKEYQFLVKGRGEDALAQVEGESCGGCFTMLTPQTMNELMMDKPVFCKSCACLLYPPEDSSA